MACWTSFESKLSDGLPIRVHLAEHDGNLLGMSLFDDAHLKGEDVFLWRINPSLPWHRSQQRTELLKTSINQLSAYFAGARQTLDLPLHLEGTPFQMRVWQQVMKIPFGETISYGELAELAGYPAAVRAVGSANRSCAFELVVPCHRVIAAGGKLGGYGNLEIKRRLLAHEAAVMGRPGTLS